MCGICGIIDFSNQIKEKKQITHVMAEKILHRGPDDSGVFGDENISLGFKRLSILDIKNGNQPIFNKNKSIVSIFNGEIYNFKEIKKELIEKGYNFLTEADSEIIPFAYEVWGIDFVKKINGMFAIAIYDKFNKKFFLVRDRVGIKPLFLFNYNSTIFFSSEINSLISVPFFEKKVNLKAISSYLSYRYPTEDEENFFQGIKRVTPGSYLEIENDKSFKKNIYWKIPFPNSANKKNERYYFDKLDELLNKSVKRQLISDVPLGVFLSGGLDSSLLTAITVKYFGKSLNTYSVTLPEIGYNESLKANLVSRKLQTNHHELVLKKINYLENLDNLIKIKGVPGSIPHEYALHLLSKEMKKKITVVLSGEGADEFFGGYSRVQKSPFDYFKFQILEKLKIRKNKYKNFLNFINSRYYWFSPQDKDNLLSENFKIEIKDDQELIENWKKNLTDGSLDENYNKVLYMFQSKHLQCLLDRLDSMTMAASIEARVPFLDHELIEFINSVPFKYKIKWKSQVHKALSLFSSSDRFSETLDINKYLLRKISKKYLPNEISTAKKLGFPIPLNQWINRDEVKDILTNRNSLSKEFFKKEALNKILAMSKDRGFDFAGKKVWMLLNIEIWMQQHFG